MQFTPESIDRFIDIYEKKFSESISREEVTDMAQRLITVYQQFLRPLPPLVMAEWKN